MVCFVVGISCVVVDDGSGVGVVCFVVGIFCVVVGVGGGIAVVGCLVGGTPIVVVSIGGAVGTSVVTIIGVCVVVVVVVGDVDDVGASVVGAVDDDGVSVVGAVVDDGAFVVGAADDVGASVVGAADDDGASVVGAADDDVDGASDDGTVVGSFVNRSEVVDLSVDDGTGDVSADIPDSGDVVEGLGVSRDSVVGFVSVVFVIVTPVIDEGRFVELIWGTLAETKNESKFCITMYWSITIYMYIYSE